MKLKYLAIAAGVLLAIAAIGALIREPGGGPPPEGIVGRSVLTPAHMEGAAKIRIDDGKSPVTLRFASGEWVVEEQFDYPANQSLLGRLLLDLNKRKIVRKITGDRDIYGELGVLTAAENNDTAADKKTGISITVMAGGEPSYHVILGNLREEGSEGTSGKGGMYVRYPGDDDAAYLISRGMRINTKPEHWVEAVVLDFDEDEELQEFRISRAGKKPIIISRLDKESDWKSAGEEEKNLNARAIREATRGMGDIFLVRILDPKLDLETLGRQRVARIDMKMFDQRVYTLIVGEDPGPDGYRTISISVSLDPSVEDEELRKTVDAYNRKFEGRFIAIHDWSADRFVVDRDYFDEPSS